MAEAEMDFHGMKRKQLQALCKKHGIPANKTNRELADRLASALKMNEAPCSQKIDEGETVEEDDSEALHQPKRVRFSPEIETREYEPTARKQRGRVTRSRAKFKETSTEDETSKNQEKEGLPMKSPRTLRNERRRKLVQECVVPEELRTRAKRNTPKSKESEPMISEGSDLCEVGGRITRLRERTQSTSNNTSAVNKGAMSDVPQKDCSEVIVAKESADGANRYPSRRKSVVVGQPRNSNSEVKMVAEASADLKGDNFQKTLGPAGNMRRYRRKNVVFDTIAAVDQVGEDESVGLEEIPEEVKRNSSTQKSRILRKGKFEVANKGRKGKASKVSSNSELEVIKDVEPSVDPEGDDDAQKICAPIGNLRRSRRKNIAVSLSGANTATDEADIEGEAVEVEGKVIKGNFSGRRGNNLKVLKRKATELVKNSKLEVISEVESNQEFEDNIDFQKAPFPTGQLRRSRRKTVMFSSLTADSVVENLKAGGTLCQFSEQVSGNDVQPIDESLGQPGKFSRHSSSVRRETTNAVDQVLPQSQRGKRVRGLVLKRESVAAKPIQSTQHESGSSKETKQKHTDCLSVSTIEDNKSTDNIIPIEESPGEAVILRDLSGSVPDKDAADTREKMEEPQSATPSKLVEGSTYQRLPSESAVNEKTLAQTAKERNVDSGIDSTGEGVYLVALEWKDANSTPISSASKLSEKKEPSISELPITQEEATVNYEVSSSKGATADGVNRGLTLLGDTVGEPDIHCSIEGILPSTVDKETPWSASKPVSTSNLEGNNYDQAGVQYIDTERDKVGKMFQSLDMSEEFNHGNLGLETEGPEMEEPLIEFHYGNEAHTTRVGKKAIPDGSAEKLGPLTPTQKHKNEESSNTEKLSVDLEAEIFTGRTEGNFKMDHTVLSLVDNDTTTFNSAERVLFLEQACGVVPRISEENHVSALSVTDSTASESKDIIKDGTHCTAYADLKSPDIACTILYSEKKNPQVICSGDDGLVSVDASKQCRSGAMEENHHISSATESDKFEVKAVEMEKVASSDAFAINLGTSDITNTAGAKNRMHYDQNAVVEEIERKLLLSEPQSFGDSKLEPGDDTRDGAAEMLNELIFPESETSEKEKGNLTIAHTVHENSHEIVNEGEQNPVIPDSQVEFVKSDDTAVGSISTALNVGFEWLNDKSIIDVQNYDSVVKDSAEVLDTNKDRDFHLEHGVNETGKNCKSSDLYEVQTGEASHVKILVVPGSMFSEPGDICTEADGAYHNDISSQANGKAASGEDIESSDIRAGSTIFTEREMDLMRGNESQHEAVESNRETKRKMEGKTPVSDMTRRISVWANAREVFQLPGESESDKLRDTEECEESATEAESTDVSEGLFKEPQNELQEAAAEEDSLDATDGLALTRVSSETDIKGSDLEDNSPITTAYNASSRYNDCQEPEETQVLDNSTQSSSKETVDSFNLASNGSSFVQEIESIGLHLLFEGQNGEADVTEPDQLPLVSDEMNKRASISPQTSTEEHIREMEECVSEAQGKQEETRDVPTIINTAASIEENAASERVTNLFNHGKECCTEPQTSTEEHIREMEECVSEAQGKQEETRDVPTIINTSASTEENAASERVTNLFNHGKECCTEPQTSTEEHIREMEECVFEAQGKQEETRDVPTIINTSASTEENATSERVTNLFNHGKECCTEPQTSTEEHIREMEECVFEAQGKQEETRDVPTIINTSASTEENAASERVTNLFNHGKECCTEPQTSTEEHIREMEECASEAQGKHEETRDVPTIINTAASIEENAASERVTNLFNHGKECCTEAKIVNFSSSSVDEMEHITEALASDKMSKHASSSLPELTEQSTGDMKNELSIVKQKASYAAAIGSFNIRKVCTPTILEEELAGNHSSMDDKGEVKVSMDNLHATSTPNHLALVQGAEDKFPSSSPHQKVSTPLKETVTCNDLLLSGRKFSSSAMTGKGSSKGKLMQKTAAKMFAAKEMNENVGKMLQLDDCQEATTETETMDVSEEPTEEDSFAGTDELAISHSSFENDTNHYDLVVEKEDMCRLTTADHPSNVYNDFWEPEETGVSLNSTQLSSKATVDYSDLASNGSSLVHKMESIGLDLLFEEGRDAEADTSEADRFVSPLASKEMGKETTPKQISVINTSVKENAACEAVTDPFKLGNENAGANDEEDKLGGRKDNNGKLMMMQRTTGKMFEAKEMKENVSKMSAPAKTFGGKRLPLQDIGTRNC